MSLICRTRSVVWAMAIAFCLIGTLKAVNADTLRAKLLLKEAHELMGAGKPMQSYPLMLQSAQIFKDAGNHAKSVKIRMQASQAMQYLNMLEESMALIREAEKDFVDHRVKNEEIRSSIQFAYGHYYYQKGKIKTAADYFSNSLTIAQNDTNTPPNIASSISGILGVCYLELGEFYLAKDLLETSLAKNIEYLGKDAPYLATNYLNAGVVTFRLGYYQQSLDYFKEADRIIQLQGSGFDPTLRSGVLSNVGGVYAETGEFELALEYMVLSLKVQEEAIGPENPLNATCYQNIGEIYLRMDQAELAKPIIEKGVRISGISQGNYAPQSLALLHTLGEVNLALGNYASADSALRAGIKIFHLTESPPYPSTINCHILLAHSFARRGLRDSAMTHIRLAEEKMALGWKNQGELAQKGFILLGEVAQMLRDPGLTNHFYGLAEASILLPDRNYQESSGAFDQYIHNYLNLKVNASKATSFQQYSRQQLSDSLQQNGIQNTIKGSQLIAELQSSGVSNEFREFLLKKGTVLYESGIYLALKDGAEQSTMDEIQLAFQFSEQNKGTLLTAALQQNQSKSFAGVPDSLVDRERQLQLELHYLRSILTQHPDTSKMAIGIRKKIIEASRKSEALQKTIEEEFPDYFRLKYHTPPPTMEEVQQWARANHSAVIEFFCGDSIGVVFAITGDKMAAYSLPNYAASIERVKTMLASIRGYQGSDLKAAWKAFEPMAHQIYNDWFSALHLQLKDEKKWVVIPDGPFTQFPLEILLPSDAKKGTNFKDADYLIRRHLISYEFSAKNLLIEGKIPKNHPTPKKVAALAPSFPLPGTQSRSEDAGLADLPFAKQEVSAIVTHLEGEALIGESASEEWLKNNANSFGILHLASHGIIDNELPMQSRILLSGTEKEDGVLHAYELFGMNLESELTVLSACNTGNGRFQRGEGMMSMARAFAFAGCPSILMSLWEVDDLSTSKLMELFYTELAAGKSKEEALRNAKISYLEQSSGIQSHPFYWAGFIQTGDRSPLGEEGTGLWILMAILATGVVGLLFFGDRI